MITPRTQRALGLRQRGRPRSRASRTCSRSRGRTWLIQRAELPRRSSPRGCSTQPVLEGDDATDLEEGVAAGGQRLIVSGSRAGVLGDRWGTPGLAFVPMVFMGAGSRQSGSNDEVFWFNWLSATMLTRSSAIKNQSCAVRDTGRAGTAPAPLIGDPLAYAYRFPRSALEVLHCRGGRAVHGELDLIRTLVGHDLPRPEPAGRRPSLDRG